ncbi:MAG TPA: DUF4145 domain-containing protein [Planctomycetaceae bacterium]|jgi:hypothetical protein|nr:DUF4145 domain-containing protein [Planctomycetaceae bacterium]
MPEHRFDKDTIWVPCSECGNSYRNHRVLFEKALHIVDDPDGPEVRREYHRLVECMGCEKIKYVISTLDLYRYDVHERQEEEDFVVYPDAPGKRGRRTAFHQLDLLDDAGDQLIPKTVWKMYRETVDALNSNILTLAAGGLRAVVEAICRDEEIDGKNLQNKIEALVKEGLLTKSQAELLHEERYLGNAALHELDTPSASDIEDGVGIVEGLINTIYVLPEKAGRLRKRRERKSKPAPDVSPATADTSNS